MKSYSFNYVSDKRKGKISAKFQSLKRVRIADTKGLCHPKSFGMFEKRAPGVFLILIREFSVSFRFNFAGTVKGTNSSQADVVEMRAYEILKTNSSLGQWVNLRIFYSVANSWLLSKAKVLLHVNEFSCIYMGVFPFNLKDEGKTPLQGHFMTKGRTLMAPIHCFEDFSFAFIEISTHHNFRKFWQDET